VKSTTPTRIALTVVFALVGAAYTAGMLFFGGAFTGAGHGTAFYAHVVAGPGGLCLLVWPTLAGLLAWLRSKFALASVLLLSLIPLAWSQFANQQQDDPYRNKVDRAAPQIVKAFWGLYFVPSAVALTISAVAIGSRMRRTQKESPPN
jgi:hypothetical protein